MEEKNNIDELFQQGLKQDFQYDENLWNQVESSLPNASKSHRGFWHFPLNSLWVLALLSISMILKTDTDIDVKPKLSINENESINTENTQLSSLSEVDTKQVRIENKTIKPIENNSKGNALTANTNQQISLTNIASRESEVSNATGISQKIDRLKRKDKTLVLPKNTAIMNSELMVAEVELTLEPLFLLNSLPYRYEKQEIIQAKGVENKNKLYKKRQYYYEIEASRSVVLNKEVSIQNPTLESYRIQAEKSNSSTNVGINLLTNYQFLQFGIGIRHSKYSERVSYQVNASGIGYDVSFDTSYYVVNGNYNSNGVPVILIRQEVERIETEKGITVRKDVFFRNEFERIQVPIIVGAQKFIGRFYGNIRTSINLNYSLQQSGAYISNDFNRINSFEEGNQIKQFVISNTYAASIGYSLNEFVLIGTRFNYEKDLNSFTKEYSSKFNQYGLGLWLMWRPQ